jgi:hypothetical protein
MSSPKTFRNWNAIHAPLLGLFGSLCVYWWWHVPVPSKAVLVIGVIAVFVPFMKMRRIHKSMWLAIVFALALIENKAINTDYAQAEDRAQKLSSTVQTTLNTTDTTLRRVQETLDTEKQTQSSVSLVGSRIDGLSSEIRIARQRNDYATAARLESEKAELQKEALLAVAPGTISSLNYWGEKWTNDDNMLERKQGSFNTDNPENLPKIQAVQTERLNLATQYSNQLRPLMTSANYLREQLLANSELTQADREQAVVFNKIVSGQTIGWRDMEHAAFYMNGLYQKSLAATSHK